MIEKLKRDHERIRLILDPLEEFLKADKPSQSLDFARLRWTLFRELNAHAALEHHALAPAGASRAGPDLHGGRDTSLDKALTEHMVAWSASAIHDDWCDYRVAASAVLVRLRRRMAYEEETVFPALS